MHNSRRSIKCGYHLLNGSLVTLSASPYTYIDPVNIVALSWRYPCGAV
jgi:hypothetical protein